jgi:hypothetical protein
MAYNLEGSITHERRQACKLQGIEKNKSPEASRKFKSLYVEKPVKLTT